MLPRSQRLSAEQFDRVIKSGKISHSPFFTVRSSIQRGTPRVSAVVPKKVCNTAVRRNKLRRRMYDAIQPIFSNIKDGVHAIIFAKGVAEDKDEKFLNEEVSKIFVKAGLLK